MGRRLEKTFFQRGHADGKQVPEKTLNIANCQGNQNHNELAITSYLLEWLSSKRPQIKNVAENVEERETSHTVSGDINWYSHCGK